MLAPFGEWMSVRLLEKQNQNRLELDALVTCRRQLLLVKTERTNRRRLVKSQLARKANDTVLTMLHKQIIDADDRIIQSIPGLAIGASAMILANFRELDQQQPGGGVARRGAVQPLDRSLRPPA